MPRLQEELQTDPNLPNRRQSTQESRCTNVCAVGKASRGGQTFICIALLTKERDPTTAWSVGNTLLVSQPSYIGEFTQEGDGRNFLAVSKISVMAQPF